MSVLNPLQFIASENQPLPAKQFGASTTQSAIKKRPLVDVKNTLHQSVHRVSKPRSKTNPAVKGKNLFNFYNDEKNKSGAKETVKEPNEKLSVLLSGATNDIDDFNEIKVEPECHCDSSINDEESYNDIYFKHLKLTKEQIDDLALNWENPSVFSRDDIREPDLDSMGPLEAPSVHNLIDYYDPLFDLLELEKNIPEVPLVELEEEPEEQISDNEQ